MRFARRVSWWVATLVCVHAGWALANDFSLYQPNARGSAYVAAAYSEQEDDADLVYRASFLARSAGEADCYRGKESSPSFASFETAIAGGPQAVFHGNSSPSDIQVTTLSAAASFCAPHKGSGTRSTGNLIRYITVEGGAITADGSTKSVDEGGYARLGAVLPFDYRNAYAVSLVAAQLTRESRTDWLYGGSFGIRTELDRFQLGLDAATEYRSGIWTPSVSGSVFRRWQGIYWILYIEKGLSSDYDDFRAQVGLQLPIGY